MTRMLFVTTMASVVLLGSGCGNADGDNATVWPSVDVVLDSIGSTPAGETLISVEMHQAGGGRIVMIHYASVGIFDSTGQYLAQVGRRGSGPGEFRRIVVSGPITPTRFWLWDSMERRLTILDLDSLTFSTSAFQPKAAEVAGRMIDGQNVRGVDTAGNTLVVGMKVAGPAFLGTKDPGATEWVFGWWPVASPGHPAIVAVTESPTDCQVRIDGKVHAIPECRGTKDDVSSDGRFVVVAIPADRSSANDRYHVVLLHSAGDTVSAFDIDLHGQPLTDSTRAEWLAGLQARDPAVRWAEVPRLPRVDPLQFVEVGNDGAIWAKGIVVDDQRAWHVISPSGEPVALFWLPDEVWIREWSLCGGLASRDLENGRVVLYRLRLVGQPGTACAPSTGAHS
jgi:hypothetical protein